MKKDIFETESKQISEKELIESRKDEMQSILPNHITMVGDVVIKSKEITIGGRKR